MEHSGMMMENNDAMKALWIDYDVMKALAQTRREGELPNNTLRRVLSLPVRHQSEKQS
jgi:hypothetical protein